MEVRLLAQEDEITLLKSSLADALRKLRLHDQQMLLLKQHLIAGRKQTPWKRFVTTPSSVNITKSKGENVQGFKAS